MCEKLLSENGVNYGLGIVLGIGVYGNWWDRIIVLSGFRGECAKTRERVFLSN